VKPSILSSKPFSLVLALALGLGLLVWKALDSSPRPGIEASAPILQAPQLGGDTDLQQEDPLQAAEEPRGLEGMEPGNLAMEPGSSDRQEVDSTKRSDSFTASVVNAKGEPVQGVMLELLKV
jgi:hypothetical protein